MIAATIVIGLGVAGVVGLEFGSYKLINHLNKDKNEEEKKEEKRIKIRRYSILIYKLRNNIL